MSAPEGYPQVNKFEQVSSVGHNMSLAFGAGWGGAGAEGRVQRETGPGGPYMARSYASW